MVRKGTQRKTRKSENPLWRADLPKSSGTDDFIADRYVLPPSLLLVLVFLCVPLRPLRAFALRFRQELQP
jgi:hypothetical protein